MSKLYILVGIPGCGKSTWAEKNLADSFRLLSSDKYREELFGDINDQTHNDEVFKHLYANMVCYLNNNENVCLDATNLTRKSRAKVFNLLKDNHIECEKIAVVFAISEDVCRMRNLERDRTVPDFVIDRMLRQFEIPFLGEGFDKIEFVDEPDKDYILNDEMLKMVGFNQNNPHHTATLDRHCEECWEHIQAEALRARIDDFVPFSMAARVHDIGKLYTQTWDTEKHYCHYIGHENYGAYKVLTMGSLNSLEDYDSCPIDYRYKLAFYINYHMEPFRLAKAKEETKEKYISQFGEYWNNILLLHEADVNAH